MSLQLYYSIPHRAKAEPKNDVTIEDPIEEGADALM